MTRVAWCTGAGKGIGRAAALKLASEGYAVAASARTSADLYQLAAQAAESRLVVRPFPLDVTDEAAVEQSVGEIEAQVGRIDLALLNAGTHMPVDVRNLQVATFRAVMATNYFGVIHGLAALLPRFIERRSGHVAVVASVAGYRGLPSAAAYGSTKAALINLCEALRPDLERYGVRLSLINPGFVRTPLTDKNDFPMPFLMEVDAAAERLVEGLHSRRFETTFPRRFTWMLKALRCMPYAGFFPIARRLVRE